MLDCRMSQIHGDVHGRRGEGSGVHIHAHMDVILCLVQENDKATKPDHPVAGSGVQEKTRLSSLGF